MADEVLNLHDNMSPGLKRIKAEAEKLAREFGNLTRTVKLLNSLNGDSAITKDLKKMGHSADQAANKLSRLKALYQQAVMLPGGAMMRDGSGRFIGTAGSVRRQFMMASNQQDKELESMRRREATFKQRWKEHQVSSHNRVSRASYQSGAALDHLARKLITLYVIFTTLQQVVSAFASVVKTYDEMISIKTRMSMINGTNQNTQQFMGGVYGMANRTRGNIQDTANLYTRIGTSGVRASNKEIASFVERFNKSMVISGTGAQENRAVMLQIAQAMGSNRLGGDEYRSIAEQAPIFKYMLAKGMGVNPGQLKKMGSEGKLTARAIMDAFQKSGAEIDKIFEKMPWTVEQLGQVIQNKWTQKVSENLTSWNTLQKEMKNFVQWLDSKEGNAFLNDVLKLINEIIEGFILFAKVAAPWVRFIVKHAQAIIVVLNMILAAILAIKGANFAMTVAGIEGAFLGLTAATWGWVAALTAGIGLLIYMQHQKSLVFDQDAENNVTKQLKDKAYKDIYAEEVAKIRDRGDAGKSSWYNDLNANVQKRWAPAEKRFDEAWAKNPMKLSNQKAADPFAELKGMLDPNKNKDINRVGEVGKINSDITISEESLKWMRALAEREWILQNEVYQPNVNMNNYISKGADVDDVVGRLAEKTDEIKGSRVCSSVGGFTG